MATSLAWGCEVHVFFCGEAPPRRGWSEDPRLVVHALPKPAGRLGRMARSLGVWRHLRDHGPFRVVHFHDPELIPAMALHALLDPDAYVLYDVHEELPVDLLTKAYLRPAVGRAVSRAAAWAWGLAGRLFDGFAPATEAIAAWWPQAQTRVVHNYPKALFGALPEGGGLDPFRAVYVGGMMARRGTLVLLEAAERVHRAEPRFRLDLVGPADEAGLEGPIRRAVEAGWCRHIPWLPAEELVGFVRGAGLGLAPLLPAPSYLESLPTKVFEYMALGIPVLASDFPLWRRLVEGAEAGRVVAPEAGALAEAMLAMMADPEGLAACARAGRAAYRDRYRWEAESRNLRWHYQKAGLALA